MPSFVNHYKVLSVVPSDSEDTIKASWRNLVSRLHPDKQPSTATDFQIAQTTALFLLVDEAWKVLGDIEQRDVYDQGLNHFQRFGKIDIDRVKRKGTAPPDDNTPKEYLEIGADGPALRTEFDDVATPTAAAKSKRQARKGKGGTTNPTVESEDENQKKPTYGAVPQPTTNNDDNSFLSRWGPTLSAREQRMADRKHEEEKREIRKNREMYGRRGAKKEEKELERERQRQAEDIARYEASINPVAAKVNATTRAQQERKKAASDRKAERGGKVKQKARANPKADADHEKPSNKGGKQDKNQKGGKKR